MHMHVLVTLIFEMLLKFPRHCARLAARPPLQIKASLLTGALGKTQSPHRRPASEAPSTVFQGGAHTLGGIHSNRNVNLQHADAR